MRLPPATPASRRVVGVLAALVPIRLPVNGLDKTAEDDPGVWGPDLIWKTQIKFLIPGFDTGPSGI